MNFVSCTTSLFGLGSFLIQGSENLKLSTQACLAQLDQHQTCKPVMVSVVSSSSNPTGGNTIFLDTSMLIFTKITEMLDLCYLRKPRM